MEIRIVECYKSSLGIIALIETPYDMVLEPGTTIKNSDNGTWKIKASSFQYKMTDVNIEVNKACRGYLIEPLTLMSSEQAKSCDSILKLRWILMG